MRISVVIPTRPTDDGTIDRCLGGLLPQLGPSDEVIVSADGVSDGFGPARDAGVTVLTGARVGPGGAKNRALEHATGDIVLFLNDDVVPRPGLLESHRQTHAERSDQPPAMVLSSAPWAVPDDDRVIDRLMRDTSMIFFYDRMNTNDPSHDWGFRHAWTLNLSVPASCVSRFDERLAYPMFDDLEWAFRVQDEHAAPVLFRPQAGVVHHHRYTPRMLLRREALLGHQAFALAKTNRACFDAVFGDRFDCSKPIEEREACESFEQLCEAATEPAADRAQDSIDELFRSCESWRNAARQLGYQRARDGADAAAVQNEAEKRFTGLPSTAS